MRLEVSIPDQLVGQAQRVATEQGITLDNLFAEAVQLHLADDDSTIKLTPEQVAKVRAAQEDVKAGRIYTPDQVREHIQAKHDAWPAAQS